VGVEVTVGVAVSTGAEEVGVAVSVGVDDVGVIVPVGVDVAVSVGVEDVGVIVPVGVEEVGVGVPVSAGAEEVGVGVGDPTDVGVAEGVEVGVGTSPTTVRLVPVEERLVSILSPFDTRAVHSIALWPACKPLALKVKAAPLVVALFPLLPAMATMKLPFCGSLIATAGSAPKRLPAVMLLTCTRLGL
jgi:hypothetical protein